LSGRKSNVVAKRGAISKKKTAAPQTVGEKLASRSKKFVSLRCVFFEPLPRGGFPCTPHPPPKHTHTHPSVTCRKTEKAKSQPSTFSRKRGAVVAAKAGPAAGSPWAAVTDPTTGNTYYFNATTNETSWTLPQ
jgi:hypothetical protein